MCDDLLIKIKECLQKVDQSCIIMDLWSNHQMKPFTEVVTRHYVHDWKLEVVMLICNCLKRRHTGEDNFQQYEETAFNINIASKIKHIITNIANHKLHN